MFRRLSASALLLALAVPVVAADKDDAAIQQAIKRGQEYLKEARRGGGGPGGPTEQILGTNGLGSASLTGLALIESGVPPGDPVVAYLARLARQNALGNTNTYDLAVMIMFLDRFGAKEDEGLIQFLTLRLMSGQSSDGAWSYSCLGLNLDRVQQQALAAELVKDVKLATPATPTLPVTPKKETKPREDLDPPAKPPAKKDAPEPKKEDPKPAAKKLHPAVEKFVPFARRGGGGGGVSVPGFGTLLTGGDHSNTQFATVGLWCGRRHGVDVSEALDALDKHYRGCQQPDGGWTYSVSGGTSFPSMACAGLMGLAMGFGSKNLDGDRKKADPDAIAADLVVDRGLRYVGSFLSAAADPKGGAGFQPNQLSRDLYFMWSLERVGMVYGLTTIGKVDWYDWGSQVLLASQQKDGSWLNDQAHYGTTENATAFALLFLSRANLAEDITTKMKGKVKDPGTSRLVKGGDIDDLLKGIGKGSTGTKKPDPGVTPKPRPDPAPAAGGDPGARLAAALVAAGEAERADLLAKYQTAKGGEYTDALARAAAKLSGDAQAQVRDALAQRLTRMSATTLNEMMKDRDRELRRAAALATGSKGKERVGEYATGLIRLIGDDEPMVVQAARASLKALSGQDHGPAAGSDPADRAKALVAWRAWWDGQKK